MTSNHHPFSVLLSARQKTRLRKAFAAKTPFALRLKPEQIGKGDELLLTTTQINHLQKSARAGHGADLKMSETQMENTAQRGGNLFSTALRFALPVAKTLGKTAGFAGLSFGAEKLLKKLFGNGVGPQEVELYKMTRKLSPAQKKQIERMLVGKGLVSGEGASQYGGILGMLASIGVPLAIDLVSQLFGKGIHVRPRHSIPTQHPPPQPKGKGLHVRPRRSIPTQPPPPQPKGQGDSAVAITPTSCFWNLGEKR